MNLRRFVFDDDGNDTTTTPEYQLMAQAMLHEFERGGVKLS